MTLKNVVRPLLPRAVVDAWRARAAARIDARFAHLPPITVFSEIYRQRLWGTSDESPYCSGRGSHNEAVLQPYLHSVREFLSQFPVKPDVVDLGCGDFNVGAQLRDRCARLVACDVVAELIAYNHTAFKHLDVSFMQLDITSDALPAGDVALVRQVLQHLSNDQIARVARKLGQYSWVVVTEHLPRVSNFTANLDKPAGPGVRLRLRSGVDLTRPPFNLSALAQLALCSVSDSSGVLHTTAYQLRA
jgi:SAM-dependent methyltransferase